MLPSGQEEAAWRGANVVRRAGSVVAVYRADAVEPAVRGIWRPTITIPQGLSEKLTEAEFEAVSVA